MQLLSSRTFRAAAAGVAALGLFLTGCTAEPEFSYEPPSQVEGALPDDTVAAMEAAVANALAASGASGCCRGRLGSLERQLGHRRRHAGPRLR